MQVKKVEILSAMRKALPGVEKNSSIIEGADSFVFANNAIHSYNDNISVSVPFPHELSGSVKSLDFFKLISKISTEEITLEEKEGQIKIGAGTVEAEMNKQAENTLTNYISSLNIQELTWKTIPTNFFEAIRLCKISCNRSTHRGIFVQENIMASTDTSRINSHKLEEEMDRFLIDDPSIVELLKISNLEQYSVTSVWVHFKSKEGIIFSCKRKDDTTYPIRQIMNVIEIHRKQDSDFENELPKGLCEVVDRVSTLSMEFNGISAVEMNLSKESIELKAERSAGKIKEKIKLDRPFIEDITLNILVDPIFLVEASRKITKFFIRKNGNNCTLVFYNDNYTQIASTFDKGKM